MGLGFRVLGLGFWVLVLGLGFWVLGLGFWVYYRPLDSSNWAWGTCYSYGDDGKENGNYCNGLYSNRESLSLSALLSLSIYQRNCMYRTPTQRRNGSSQQPNVAI